MWKVSSGDCVMSDGCISSSNFPESHEQGDSCRIEITPAWIGFLHVEYFDHGSYDVFLVDDVPYSSDLHHQSSPLHGSVPRNSIVWSAGTNVHPWLGWRICQVDSMSPFSAGRYSDCATDHEGCLVLGRFSVLWDEHYAETSYYPCVVSIDETWKGSLDLTLSNEFNHYGYRFSGSVTVGANGVTYTATNIEDLKIMGVQGLEPHGSFEVTWLSYYFDFKICSGPPANESGPWGEQPWTCNVNGDPCDSACTQQFSDRSDADADGDLHDGHPLCPVVCRRILLRPMHVRSCRGSELRDVDIVLLHPAASPNIM